MKLYLGHAAALAELPNHVGRKFWDELWLLMLGIQALNRHLAAATYI